VTSIRDCPQRLARIVLFAASTKTLMGIRSP
jgi:hypothetical protein